MKDVQRIAIVDPSDATREELRNLLLGRRVDLARSRVLPLRVLLRRHPASPARTWCIVSLDSDQNKALQLIGQLTQVSPDLPILAVSAAGDGQSILQALRSGAREFLTAPVVLEELLKAPAAAAARPASDSRQRRQRHGPTKVESQVIAVLGSRGGVGCTSLAVNLGATLAQDPTNSVALVDLDLALGDADVALDLMPDYTLADVALNIDRLDMTVPAALAVQARLRPVAAAAPGADGGHRPDPRGAPAARDRPAAGQLHAPDPRPEQELHARPT